VEIYVSTDVETDGPIPGPHSMLSIGSAAYSAQKELLATFTANLELLPGAAPDPETAAWWASKPEAWAACRPKHWFDSHPHTHIALDDAIEQGALFCNMLAENLADPGGRKE